MPDQDSRSAARLAAVIAVPVALLTGVGLFLVLTNALDPAETAPPVPTATPTGPVATGPVTTPERELTEWEETVCRALVSQLPGEVGELAQRPVTAGPEQNAAYGDPPLTVTCGGLETGYQPTDTVYPLPGGVCWHLAEDQKESVWTSVDREVPVRVSVPASYDGPGQLVTELTGTVAQTVRSAETAPSGCDT